MLGYARACRHLCPQAWLQEEFAPLMHWMAENVLLISPLFLSLMFLVTIGNGVFVGRCMRVGYPDIVKDSLKSTSPEYVYCNVESCRIICVGDGSGEGFSCE